jgi:DNA mismatch endonuclease, patch repair protein
MTDVFTKEKRREIMQSVRRQGTRPEESVARMLKLQRIRFQQQPDHLPGRPDFLFADTKLVLFVHGCFWHGHHRCKKGTSLSKTDPEYWLAKIKRNQRRDRRVTRQLRSLGYQVYTIWECQVTNRHSLPARIKNRLVENLP